MNVLGITAARGGSKGVPRKNVRDLGGIPLIAHTLLEVANKCKMMDAYCVATEDEEIARIAGEYAVPVVMLPEHLTTDTSPLLPALQHAIEEMEWLNEVHYDIIADLRCTNPFKLASDIDGAIDKLIRTDADAVIGVTVVEDHHPSRLKRIFRDRLVDIWPEPRSGLRQDLRPEVYVRNGAIYIVKREALDAGIHIKASDDVRPWIMPPERSLNIDTPTDFLLAEVLYEKR